MKNVLGLVLAAVVLLGAASGAEAQGIDRHGFTLQLSLGAGASTFLPKEGEGDKHTYGGLGVTLQLGGFLTRDFALTGKITGINWGAFRTDEVDLGIVGFLGPVAQFWFGDHFSVEGGIAIGTSGVQAKSVKIAGVTITPDEDTVGGVGLDFAANYFPFAVNHHALGIQAQFQPTFTKDGPILSYQLAFVWQYY